MKDETPAAVGGRCCLALVNSVWWRRSARPQEQLHAYADLLMTVGRAGWLDSRSEVLAEAARRPAAAAAALGRAITLREALFAVFTDVAAGEPASPAALSVVSDCAAEGAGHQAIRVSGAGYERYWPGSSLELPMWQAADSAVILLTGPELGRVKQCPGEPCGWVFVDETRNHSRRWCDGRECGNRERVRAHYERARQSRTPSPAGQSPAR